MIPSGLGEPPESRKPHGAPPAIVTSYGISSSLSRPVFILLSILGIGLTLWVRLKNEQNGYHLLRPAQDGKNAAMVGRLHLRLARGKNGLDPFALKHF